MQCVDFVEKIHYSTGSEIRFLRSFSENLRKFPLRGCRRGEKKGQKGPFWGCFSGENAILFH